MNTPSLITKPVVVLFVCIAAAWSPLAAADSIQLRNGRHLQGKFIGGTTTMIGFMTTQSVEYFQTSDVVALMFDDVAPSANGLPQSHMDGNSAQPTCSPAAQRVATRRRRSSKSEIRAGL